MERLYITDDEISAHVLHELFGELHEAQRAYQSSSTGPSPTLATSSNGSGTESDKDVGPAARSAGLLATLTLGQGSSRPPKVEVPGIEPGSSVASTGLLRAQFAMPLLGPIGHANKPM